jgi:hypothetical protein
MTYDDVCVSLVGEKTLSLKVDNPKYVMENTFPMIQDMDEEDAFKFFHYWVARAIQLWEIEHSEKEPNRIVVREHPEKKHRVVLSYDNTSVKLETLGKTLFFPARFPHFVFEHLIMDLEMLTPKNTLFVFHRHASEMANMYENPDEDIIFDYFKDYEFPEDTYDYEEPAPVPVPVPAPVPVPRKSWFNMFRMFRRS